MITPDLIRALNARHPDPVTAATKLGWAFDQQGLTDPLVVAHLLAQLAHESGLVPREENLHYRAERLANTVYGSRMGNTHLETAGASGDAA